jgi:hypothetical protein
MSGNMQVDAEHLDHPGNVVIEKRGGFSLFLL